MRHITRKTVTALIISLAAMLLICGCGNTSQAESGTPAKPEAVASRYDGLARLEGAEVSGRYALYEGDDRLEKDIVCIGNRPYIYADYSESLGELSRPLYEDENGVYMALSDFVVFNDACAEFFPEDESVRYYHKEPYPWRQCF